MYPLLDTTTLNRAVRDERKAAEAARAARSVTPARPKDVASHRGVRHAVGASLVRAGLRLINA
jgi:hypothetical protein